MNAYLVIRMLALSTALIASSASFAYAGITWQTPFNIADNSDVNIKGEYIYAFNMGGATDVIVNGVIFNAFTWEVDPPAGEGVVVGSVTISPDITPARLVSKGNASGGSSRPFASLSPEYRTLIGTIALATAGYTHVTLADLNPGTTYQVQFWVNDSRNVDLTRDATVVITSDGTSSEPLSLQVGGDSNQAAGNLGQTVIATFVANAPTQTFVIEGQKRDHLNRPAYSYINAISLRLVAAKP